MDRSYVYGPDGLISQETNTGTVSRVGNKIIWDVGSLTPGEINAHYLTLRVVPPPVAQPLARQTFEAAPAGVTMVTEAFPN
ncbi:MAG: hypothetical protein AAB303_03430, partial [Chloroflexota bacterium]